MQPTITSSAYSLNYAEEYPERLKSLNQRFIDSSQNAEKGLKTFSRFVDQLQNPQWNEVKTIYEKADLAGRSFAMMQWQRDRHTISDFIDTRTGPLSQSMARHIHNYLDEEIPKEKGDIDLRPTLSWSLKSAIHKELEDRYQEINDAHRFIIIYKKSLGKRNLKVIKEQVDIVTEVSFIVFVDLLNMVSEMQGKLDDADEVKHTLDNEIAGLQLITADPESSSEDKKAADRRIAALLKIKTPIDEYADKTEELIDTAQQKSEKLQGDYEEAFDKLLDQVEKKIEESAP